ncbi:cubilin-like [Dreissena polymorpha]|uniref:cubilin-like n=1 Tax=Dreissena polymorpha TaxID=45954 RepID=UPI002264BEFB|nr:cubilin-like [Dreissena polymorpha]
MFNISHRETRRASENRRRLVIIAVAVTVTFVLIVGAIVGAVIASAVAEDGNDQPIEYVEIDVTKDIKTEVTLVGKEFDVDYLNMSSDKSLKAAADLEKMYDDKFTDSEYKDMYVGTTVLGFRNGSLIADVKSEFKKKVKIEKKRPADTTSETTTQAKVELSAEDMGLKIEVVISIIEKIPDIKPNAFSDFILEEDECDSSPCQNSGTCEDRINRYVCLCPPGYSGINCETDIDECDNFPCKLEGICKDSVNNYTCTCQRGTTGRNCEINIDDCASRPCMHGNCTDKVAGFTCSCYPGYSGSTCQTDIDDCVGVVCQNGGTCRDMINGFICSCAHGFVGLMCETSKYTR